MLTGPGSPRCWGGGGAAADEGIDADGGVAANEGLHEDGGDAADEGVDADGGVAAPGPAAPRSAGGGAGTPQAPAAAAAVAARAAGGGGGASATLAAPAASSAPPPPTAAAVPAAAAIGGAGALAATAGAAVLVSTPALPPSPPAPQGPQQQQPGSLSPGPAAPPAQPQEVGDAELNDISRRLNRVGITVFKTHRDASGRVFVARFSTKNWAKEHGITTGRLDKTGCGWGHAGMWMALQRLVLGAENSTTKGAAILKEFANKSPEVQAKIVAVVRAVAGELPLDMPARQQMLDAVEGR